jgi:hypothetical protein
MQHCLSSLRSGQLTISNQKRPLRHLGESLNRSNCRLSEAALAAVTEPEVRRLRQREGREGPIVSMYVLRVNVASKRRGPEFIICQLPVAEAEFWIRALSSTTAASIPF